MATVRLRKFDIGYTQVPNSMLCDPNLSSKAKGIYCYLFSKPDGWQFHTSTREKELQEGKDSFYAGINELVSAGYIEREQLNENGTFGGTIYRFVRKSEIDTVSGKPVCGKPVCGKPGRLVRLTSSKTDSNIPPIIPPKGEIVCSEDFEHFWDEYKPVKVDGRFVSKGSKILAQKKYESIIKKGSKPEDILNGLKAYLNFCRANRLLSCGVSVFLNQERWKNEYESASEEIMI